MTLELVVSLVASGMGAAALVLASVAIAMAATLARRQAARAEARNAHRPPTHIFTSLERDDEDDR